MAFTFTVTGRNTAGAQRKVYGTFISETGDSSASLNNAVHGLNFISDFNISLDKGGIGVESPKVTINEGSLTALWSDTLGYSGRWMVEGRG
jgi:hypothetical protein